MTDTSTHTYNSTSFFSLKPAPALNTPAQPRLRLLFHADLERIGALTTPEMLLRGEWLEVGRRAPLFTEPLGGMEQPIRDACVSRRQLRVRWLAGEGCFEVAPVPSAKRRVGVIYPGLSGADWDAQGIPCVHEIHGPTMVPPGSCVAVEDRLLIGLDLVTEPLSGGEPRSDRFGLVGESEVMWSLRDEIARVAGFRQPALVLGPTGSGKELVARALHAQSARREGPFVVVNCAALPPHLVESMLFGHTKGAFTGADSHQAGLMRAASGGTLFLDELGEMPIDVQPRLLRAVQDGVIRPVGQDAPVHVDVRLIAATHRDPHTMIRSGRLREDLYHRLASHILRVPSLGARRFDVPGLFLHALREMRARHTALRWLWSDPGAIPLGFFVTLMHHTWTGNVRELQNIAARTARLNLKRGAFRPPEPFGGPTRSNGARPTEETVPAFVEVHDEERVRRSSALTQLKASTLARLIHPAELERIWERRRGDSEESQREALLAQASAGLVQILINNDFRQRHAALEAGVSLSTFIKLMGVLGVPRARDLSLETIEEALASANGNIDAAAEALKVSPLGLKKRLTLLRLKRR